MLSYTFLIRKSFTLIKILFDYILRQRFLTKSKNLCVYQLIFELVDGLEELVGSACEYYKKQIELCNAIFRLDDYICNSLKQNTMLKHFFIKDKEDKQIKNSDRNIHWGDG